MIFLAIYYECDKNVFISRLKALRKDYGLTQPQLGEMIGMSRGAVGHWEAGTRIPNMDTIYTLSRIFNVSADYLIGASNYKSEDESISYVMNKLAETYVFGNADIDRTKFEQMLEYIKLFEKVKLTS